METVDIVVIGGGIAGMSAAYALSQSSAAPSILVCEAEASLTHHTTGRSAAVFIENYGAMALRSLTLASKPFYLQPPDGLVDGPLLSRKGYLGVAGPDDLAGLEEVVSEGQATNPDIVAIEASEACALAPLLRPERVAGAVYEPDASGIDVAGLHQGFVRGLRRAGGKIATTQRVDAACPTGDGGWSVATTNGEVQTKIVINAAGAWGDLVASSAGVEPIGLEPKRRTAFMVNSPFPESDRWPLIASYAHDWYTNPDGSQFLCSPADETDSPPCDAKPEEVDVALAIERINIATTLDITAITSSWAGLRTFSPDRSMVIGADPAHSGFFWCVGQGGTGIQTAPGAGQLCADLVTMGKPGPSFDNVELDLSGLTPDRLRN